MCALHTTGLLALAEGLDPLSVSVVRLSRNSYTTHSFIGGIINEVAANSINTSDFQESSFAYKIDVFFHREIPV